MEEEKAISVNRILDLDEPKHQIQADEMIMCSTPFRDLAEQYKNKYVLIAGCGDVMELAHDYGFRKAIHVQEYSSLFPILSPLNNKYRNPQQSKETIRKLKERFSGSLDIEKVQNGSQKVPIAACFVFHDMIELEESVQIITDLWISKDGVPGSVLPTGMPQEVKLYISSPDLVYVNDFKLKRYGQGIFKLLLDSAFHSVYGRDPEINVYGKPSNKTFEYCKKVIDQRAEEYGVSISDYYMIGDNPSCDIRGARQAGWKSILVKTGVFQPIIDQSNTRHYSGIKGYTLTNDDQDPADYVVEDFKEAVDLIFNKEGVE